MTWRTANGNITSEKLIDLSAGDYVDEAGFFFRSGTGGIVKYLPFDATDDSEAITKTIDASPYFIDPVVAKKIFQLITTPDTEIYVGYGV